ncbi:TraR/DksA C4-type zinc finger protein [Paenisporosarcina sp. TG-14]|uniref:TraR/DksA C4-type zinc finger protein n=1 Tax=Paenisporosarcina sp. TG-14 TaxID=1231057 RepID=UPI0002FC74D9|nr:TraR/DksA C4-type zinc finger protein [Paenisporosarcina sp. TG-14]
MIKNKGCDRILTDKQKSELKKDLLAQKIQLENHEDNPFIEQGNIRDTTGELSTADNHPADLGTELYEREKDMAIKVHEHSELEKVNHALEAMKNGTYGVCDDCGESIPYERLEALPYTTRCIEHAEKTIPLDRPSEEQILIPANDNSFAERHKSDGVRDYEDSFQEVAQYGTSETPSDLKGDHANYNELYDDEDEEGMDEEVDSMHIITLGGDNKVISLSEQEEAIRNDYL